jgi:TRAP-type uncharacterized transport system substrate-binding protein
MFHKPRATPNASRTITLATGSSDGTYYLLGKAIAEVGQSEGIKIQACSTGGSYDNIALLQEGSVSLALAQIDALDDVVLHGKVPRISMDGKGGATQCTRLSQAEAKRPALVSYLYGEMVHLILRPHFYVGSLTDLKQDAQHVWLGRCGSGSRKTAERLLQASGMVESDLERQFPDCDPLNHEGSMRQITDWKTASDRLLAPSTHDGRDDHLDAFFWTRAVQTIEQPAQGSTVCQDNPASKDKNLDPIYCLLEREAHIAPLQSELIERMATDSLYVETAIPLDAYGGKRLKQGVPTVGLATVLIAPESYQEDEIRNLIAIIEQHKSTIERRTGVELDLLDKKVREHEELASFIHSGARNHLSMPNLRIIWIVAIASLSAVLILLIYRAPRLLTANPPAVSYTILLFAILVLLWGGFAFKLKEAEGRFNPNFETTATSMRTMLSYVVGSFRDRKPVTRQGENLIAWALFVIPLVFGWLTSDIIKEGVRKLSHWLAGAIARIGARTASGLLLSIARWLKRPKARNA